MRKQNFQNKLKEKRIKSKIIVTSNKEYLIETEKLSDIDPKLLNCLIELEKIVLIFYLILEI